MIMLTENVYIGAISDAFTADPKQIGAILSVALDLKSKVGWPEFEYMQVGLIDGPGNPIHTYIAAALALATLAKKHKTLVFCHEGGRSLAVSIMYMEFFFKRGWDGWLELLDERTGMELPVPHEAHRAAFDKIDWEALRKLAGVKL